MDEKKEKGEDFKKVVKLQALARGFIKRLKYVKFKDNKQDNYFNFTTYPARGPPPRGPPKNPVMNGGIPPKPPQGMFTYHTVDETTEEEKNKEGTEGEQDEETNSNKEKINKKKSISLHNILSLAKLVQKEIVNEDEFRDIVKRIRKRNEQVEWSLKQELILKSIGEKSLCYFLLHRDISERYRNMYQVSMMHIFTQTMVSSVLMFIASGVQSSKDNNLILIPIIAGVLNLIIALQQKILEFKQPERYMLEHATSSKSFREIYDDINIQLGLARKERNPMPVYLTNMRDKYTMSKKIAPYVSDLDNAVFKKKYLDIPNRKSELEEQNWSNYMNIYQLTRRDLDTVEHDIKIQKTLYSRTNGKNRKSKSDIETGEDRYDDVESLSECVYDILSRKKQNGIPEDIMGLNPIDISKRDIILSDIKRQLDKEEEVFDYDLRSKQRIHQLKKKYHREEEDYNYDMELNSSDSSVVSSDNEEDKKNDGSEPPVRLLIKEKSKNNI